MPNKRSRYKKTPKFYCPYCGERLWRFGSEKHRVFYEGAANIKKHLGISSKKAKFLAMKGEYLDTSSWLEELFCSEHSKMWMLVSKQKDGTYQAILAEPNHWKQGTKLIDPNHPNPSVSEYTYRSSRGTVAR
ncbi:MAG: hypothetical protein BRC33_07590 [Cyanobacteria bacterium SW_9_44_58]|nr:MAG: hypothetical protein BRC33_07590 [Cyanobacteria bacterium SW_9_44_58]